MGEFDDMHTRPRYIVIHPPRQSDVLRIHTLAVVQHPSLPIIGGAKAKIQPLSLPINHRKVLVERQTTVKTLAPTPQHPSEAVIFVLDVPPARALPNPFRQFQQV